MRKFLTVLLSLALALTLCPAPFAAAAGTPVIALTHKPACGESSPFAGVVFMEDGSAFDPTDYRISLYLQISEGGEYWVKPTYAKPYAEVGEDGMFSIAYATGGSDTQAKIIHIMLIPASYTPTASFNETKSAALFYVKVARTAEGAVTVEPDIDPAPPTPGMPSGLLPVKQDKIAVNVGFYTDGSQPGSALSKDLIRQQLNAVSAFSDTVRFYGASGELYKAYGIACDMGFTVLGNAWLSGDKTANQKELDALVEHCNQGLCRIAIVGSETLLRGDLTAEELIAAINYVRERIADETIPVTTADSIDQLLAMPSVRAACDVLMPNCYPYWGGSSIEEAAGHFIANMEALDALRGGKEIVVSETGWPTAGQGIGSATAGEAEAARYYAAIREWSLASDTQVLYFDATDEPWKAQDENEAGAHWGFMTEDFQLKDCYEALNPFFQELEVTFADVTDAAATVSLTNHTGAAVNVVLAVAAYDEDGRMAACQLDVRALAEGASEALSVSWPSGKGVKQIRAFVLDAETLAPLRGASAKYAA